MKEEEKKEREIENNIVTSAVPLEPEIFITRIFFNNETNSIMSAYLTTNIFACK